VKRSTKPRSRRNQALRPVGFAVLAVVALALPWFVRNPYIMHLVIMALIYGVLGMTFSLLFAAGRMTLGAGAFYLLGAYCSTALVLRAGLPVWAALFITPVICSVASWGLGAVLCRGTGFSFGIITMLIALAIVQVVGQLSFFGGWTGFTDVPRPETIPLPFNGHIAFTGKTPYYYLILAIATVISLCFYALYSSKIGRTWNSIKLSHRLAEAVGVNLYRYRLLAFVMSSTAAAWVGAFYVHYNTVIEPTSFSGFFSISVQFYAVLGGINYYIAGPFVGAFVMIFVPEVLRVTAVYNDIITGALLIVLILFLPNGIVGTIMNAIRRRRGQPVREAPTLSWRAWALSRLLRRGD
jgi:branched-chain amino acid transport system permease protein